MHLCLGVSGRQWMLTLKASRDTSLANFLIYISYIGVIQVIAVKDAVSYLSLSPKTHYVKKARMMAKNVAGVNHLLRCAM
jgi:hypothetical protein